MQARLTQEITRLGGHYGASTMNRSEPATTMRPARPGCTAASVQVAPKAIAGLLAAHAMPMVAVRQFDGFASLSSVDICAAA